LQSGIFLTPLRIFTVIDVFSRVASSCSSMCDTMLCHFGDSKWHWSCVSCERFQSHVYDKKHRFYVIHQKEVALQQDVTMPPTSSACFQFTSHMYTVRQAASMWSGVLLYIYILHSFYVLKSETFYVHGYMIICFCL
jgi:hypothetical protein